jgi:hypothetical protein
LTASIEPQTGIHDVPDIDSRGYVRSPMSPWPTHGRHSPSSGDGRPVGGDGADWSASDLSDLGRSDRLGTSVDIIQSFGERRFEAWEQVPVCAEGDLDGAVA